MFIEDEINAAKNSLDEGQGEQIEDAHEDSVHIMDPDDLLSQSFSSYKKENKVIRNKLNEQIKELNRQKDVEIASLDPTDSNRQAKAEDIEKRYSDLITKANEEFEKCDAHLREKYADEIKYHIHPKLKRRKELIDSDILLSVRNLKQFFFFGSKIKNQKLKAVSNVSFDVYKGECFGIVGESGCGKTTTGRTIIKLYKPTSGSIYYRGYRIGAGARWNQKEIKWTRIRYYDALEKYHQERDAGVKQLKANGATNEEIKAFTAPLDEKIAKEKQHYLSVLRTQRKKIKQIRFDMNHVPKHLMNEIQMIFQDPVDSLDPRMTVEDIIQEGLRIKGSHNRKKNHGNAV
mgnify:CR=1 FL=1